ncbi:hypothetical protein DIPPA_04345 [Diplonema papillatum]|nr:hypothetical protein DIPPA_04345 [Diplonema papillatum]
MADQKVFNYTEAKEWMSEMWAEWSKKSDAETYQCNNSVKPRMKPSDQVIKELSVCFSTKIPTTPQQCCL